MAYVAVDKCGQGWLYTHKPERDTCLNEIWMFPVEYGYTTHPEHEKTMIFPASEYMIEKLIGRKLAWEDEPVELKEED